MGVDAFAGRRSGLVRINDETAMPALKRNHSLVHKLRVDAHAAWLAARDPRAPWYARALGLLITAYALSPIDLIPDFIPVLGLVDDAIIVPLGLWAFVRMLPPGLFEECREKAEAASERPTSAIGVAIVILVWIAAAWFVFETVEFFYN